MFKLLRLLVLMLMTASGYSWQQTTPSSKPPLTEEEKHKVLDQLIDYGTCIADRQQLQLYREVERRLHEQEVKNKDDALVNAKKETELMQKDRDLAVQKGQMWEDLYRSVTKKSGVGCFMKRLFTAFIYRCR